MRPLRRRDHDAATADRAARGRRDGFVRRQPEGAEGDRGAGKKEKAQAVAGHDPPGERCECDPRRSESRESTRPRGARFRAGRSMNPFSWDLPYSWPRKPLLARNVVATSQPLAAQAGLAMLAAGGNAVDAALATAITLTLVEPVSNGIGSDAFAIIWDGKQLHGMNASGRAPAGWTP